MTDELDLDECLYIFSEYLNDYSSLSFSICLLHIELDNLSKNKKNILNLLKSELSKFSEEFYETHDILEGEIDIESDLLLQYENHIFENKKMYVMYEQLQKNFINYINLYNIYNCNMILFLEIYKSYITNIEFKSTYENIEICKELIDKHINLINIELKKITKCKFTNY